MVAKHEVRLENHGSYEIRLQKHCQITLTDTNGLLYLHIRNHFMALLLQLTPFEIDARTQQVFELQPFITI